MRRGIYSLIVLFFLAFGPALNNYAAAAINDPSSINSAVATAARTGGTVTISTAKKLKADLTVPSNVSIVISYGGKIVKTSNYTLDINGPFSAGLYQVFSDFNPGDITFGNGSIEKVIPQWWGAKGDGITDDSGPINSAIAALPANGGEISLVSGNYLITNTVKIYKKIFFHGTGGYGSIGTSATIITKAAWLNGPAISVSGTGSVLERFWLKGQDGNVGDGIRVAGPDATNIVLEKIGISRIGRDGIRIGQDNPGGNQNEWRIDSVISVGNGRNGVTIDDDNSSYLNPANANAGTSTSLQVINNGQDGLFINMGGVNTFIGTLAELNHRYGVHLSHAAHWEAFFGGDFNEANKKSDFMIAPSDPGQGVNMIFGAEIGRLTDHGERTMIQAPVRTLQR